MTLDRTPSQCPASEREILNCVLLHGEAARPMLGPLEPRHFADPLHTDIFRCMEALWEGGEPVDLATVTTEAQALGFADLADGTFIAQVAGEAVGAVASLGFHVREVLRAWQKRELKYQWDELTARMAQDGEDIDDILDEAASLRTRLALPTDDGVLVAQARLEGLMDRLKSDRRGIRTGFASLDRAFPGGGLQGFIVLGGGPGVGKTSHAKQIADQALELQPDLVVLFASGETALDVLDARTLSRLARVDCSRILAGTLEAIERERVEKALARYRASANRLIYLNPAERLTVRQIRLNAERHKAGLVVIDHLHLIRPSRPCNDRRQEVNSVVQDLTALCRSLDAPLLVLSEFSRGPGGRGYEPGRGLEAFKESGDIEYAADVCLALELTQESYVREQEGHSDLVVGVRLRVLKNRTGGKACLPFTFVRPTSTFEEGDRMEKSQAEPRGASDGTPF